MSCITYDKDNPNLIFNSTYNNTGGVINYGSSAAARFDKVDISNKVVYLRSLNLNNKNYTCFYDSNSNFITNSCSLYNSGDLNSLISIPDNAVYIGISLNRNDNTPVFEICDIEASPNPSPFDLPFRTYLPTDYINSNYLYYFNGKNYIVKINESTCVDIFPKNDYLVSEEYSCSDVVGSPIDYKVFTDVYSYRVDFVYIVVMLSICLAGMIFLLSCLSKYFFKGVFK